MQDPFKKNVPQNYPQEAKESSFLFPDFNAQMLPRFDEGNKTKTSKNIDKGTDILKSTANLYMYGLGVVALLIFLPAILRLLYEFSCWAYDFAGTIFP
jgi:hypothetical protein